MMATAAASGDYPPSSASTTASQRRRPHQGQAQTEAQPPVAPPRTSSSHHHQTSTTTSASGNSRRSTRTEDKTGKTTSNSHSSQQANTTRKAVNGNGNGNGTGRNIDEDSRPGSVSLAIRPNTAGSSKQPSREASEVLNRVIVSQPEVDLDREQARLDDAQAHQYHHQQYTDAADAGGAADVALIAPTATKATNKEQQATAGAGAAAAAAVAAAEVTTGTGTGTGAGEGGRRGGRNGGRQDQGKKDKISRFGDYYLGNTIGEGEFGKVKLGWKQDGGVQVAIKLIRRDSVGNNPSRLAKIYREVSILRGVCHPNIVRLHEMTETDRHIGIILEYASGGELFDYILHHRYLKDNAARRLFAQLVSGVGYMHKKGIVHRDLKLENLLLDRNRNIIITDFGFANTFDASDELTEDQELGLADRDYVRRTGLDRTKSNGMRRGDLMQTSCGSPCYAAPELVVSDSLYTGRKVDVWSCGVILYAMLAGYLPFDDDPANPEGDNINLLYKYIVNTPLTFPEYVTPHARDLLRRILVPSPRKRADLFEVARHSWLSEFAHVVEFITSATTTTNDIMNTTVPAQDEQESAAAAGLARSASVREPTTKPKTKTSKSNKATSNVNSTATTVATVGDLARKQGSVDTEDYHHHHHHQHQHHQQQKQQQEQHQYHGSSGSTATHQSKSNREGKDNKRRTVQVEYVAPTTQTQRGGDIRATSSGATSVPAPSTSNSGGRSRARSSSRGPTEVTPSSRQSQNQNQNQTQNSPRESRIKPPSTHRNTYIATSNRPSRDTRAASDTTFVGSASPGHNRPQTQGSVHSASSRHGLASSATPRSSYAKPTPPTVAGTNVHGSMANANGFSHSTSSTATGPPTKFSHMSAFHHNPSSNANTPPSSAGGSSHQNNQQPAKGHKRSNTLGDIGAKVFGRSGSLFGGRNKSSRPESHHAHHQPQETNKARKYPPVSLNTQNMSGNFAAASVNQPQESSARPSIDSRVSRRSFSQSLGLNQKQSGSLTGSQASHEGSKGRRFSLMKAIGLRSESPPLRDEWTDDHREDASYQYQDRRVTDENAYRHGHHDETGQQRQHRDREDKHHNVNSTRPSAIPSHMQQEVMVHSGSDSCVEFGHPGSPNAGAGGTYQPSTYQTHQGQQSGYDSEGYPVVSTGVSGLQKNSKRFVDAYGGDEMRGSHDHAGSSGAAKRVMDFFRRRGKARGEI